jgi:hypothetical protein
MKEIFRKNGKIAHRALPVNTPDACGRLAPDRPSF